MKDVLLKELVGHEEHDDMDIYLEDSRVMEEDDDEIEPWELAWMKGYDEAG